ncbi:phage protein [Xenorhabdus vietnamensis]|uniref:Phage protein n=1 Tax=Xenorhabdus vietnamensis TaxID=351656 RepID=A0A1Y2S913_9GAMM|nr:phage protein [Xenorhabdus vietnamensis]
MTHKHITVSVIDMSTHKNTRRGNPPFQFRLDPELRALMEIAQAQDGDESLAAWIKRIVRRELQSRGIESNP